MNYVPFLKMLTIGTICFIGMDLLWIGFIMNKQYTHYLAPIARQTNGKLTPNLMAGLLVWLIIVAGMLIFVGPKIAVSSLSQSFLWGALYGFILYGMYDLTNLSVLAHWPLTITLIDIAWGTFANGLLGMIIWFLQRKL